MQVVSIDSNENDNEICIELSHKVRNFHKLEIKPEGTQVWEVKRDGSRSLADNQSISSKWLLSWPPGTTEVVIQMSENTSP